MNKYILLVLIMELIYENNNKSFINIYFLKLFKYLININKKFSLYIINNNFENY